MSNEIEKTVKIALLNAGIRQKEIAKQFGFDKGDVCKVISGKRATPAIRQAIADVTGKSVAELFLIPAEPLIITRS